MTQDKTTDAKLEAALDVALADARATPPVPGDAILSRIAEAGVEVQRVRAQQARRPKAHRPRAFWEGFRLWPALTGLAACLVVGIGLGIGFQSEIGALTAYYLTDAEGSETVLWSYELALLEDAS